MIKVIGFDLSLASTGVASVYHGATQTASIKSSPPKTPRHPRTGKPLPATLAQRNNRLYDLVAQVLKTVDNVQPDLVCVEGPSLGQSRQKGEHDRAGLWWLVVQALHSEGWAVAEIPPASVKTYATGKGNAAKDAVLAAVVRRYPHVDVAGNDEADALVLAAMGARHLGHPIDDMPKAHLSAMDKVTWPAGAAS